MNGGPIEEESLYYQLSQSDLGHDAVVSCPDGVIKITSEDVALDIKIANGTYRLLDNYRRTRVTQNARDVLDWLEEHREE